MKTLFVVAAILTLFSVTSYANRQEAEANWVPFATVTEAGGMTASLDGNKLYINPDDYSVTVLLKLDFSKEYKGELPHNTVFYQTTFCVENQFVQGDEISYTPLGQVLKTYISTQNKQMIEDGSVAAILKRLVCPSQEEVNAK